LRSDCQQIHIRAPDEPGSRAARNLAPFTVRRGGLVHPRSLARRRRGRGAGASSRRRPHHQRRRPDRLL